MRKQFVAFLLCIVFCINGFTQTTSDVIADSKEGDTTNTIFNEQTLQPFYQDLFELAKNRNRQLHILHLGDSHIQMGYFTGEMRKILQPHFGLSAVGLLFPYPMARYKPFYVGLNGVEGKWQGSNYLQTESGVKYGISGFTIETKSKEAKLELWAKQMPELLSLSNKITLYYSGDDSCTIIINGIHQQKDSSRIIPSVQVEQANAIDQKKGWKKSDFYFEEEVNKLVLSVSQKNENTPFRLFGLQFLNINRPGIVYHNAGVGGATFMNLCNNASLSISQMKDINPNLVILSYGSNEGYTSTFEANTYYEQIKQYIFQIKNATPRTNILLTSPPDSRAKNRYPRNLDSISYVLNKIAAEEGIAYWDLRKQMGGDGAVLTWLKAGLASTDKLHFTKEGYELQARMLCEALLNGYNRSVSEKDQIPLPPYQKPVK